MCGWDGTVRILGMGISSAGSFTALLPEPPAFLPYMSPEQIGGESIDARSNIFSLGSIFYEMVTEHRAFGGDDAASIQRSILEDTPVAPLELKARMHPQLSALIMKALSKDPAQRYQTGRDLLDDLEQCKESKTASSAPAPKPSAPAKAVAAPKAPAAVAPKVAEAPKPVVASAPVVPVKPKEAIPAPIAASTAKAAAAETKKFAAAAATGAAPKQASTIEFEPLLGDAASTSPSQPKARMSAAPAPAAEPPATSEPKIAVDPMMADKDAASSAVSFSEISELPPYKEVVIVPPAPSQQQAETTLVLDRKEEKPRIQPRDVAEKAFKEIKGVPPQLLLYSIAGAVVLILVIAIGLYLHNSSSDDDSSARPAQETARPTTEPATSSVPAPQPERIEAAAPVPTVVENVSAAARQRNARKKAPAAAPITVTPGEMALDSTPEGAQVQIDGSSNTGWITPYTLTGLKPGTHTITVFKAGFVTDTRNVDVASGSKSFVTVHLAAMMAALTCGGTPSGASILVDGKDTGKVTPAQLSLDKGQHTIVVRKTGYLDESSSFAFTPGQTVAFSPALRPLGNVDDLKTVGKFKKMFGKGSEAGMGTVSIHTTPKGAQVAVNQHLLDKFSPVDVMLDPGNYVLDITLTGYAPIHKVISVDKAGKAVVDETLSRQ
jgi:serine/threonine-protein kinase